MTHVEAAARAIRATVAERIGSTATSWDELKEYQREAYFAEARAALAAATNNALEHAG